MYRGRRARPLKTKGNGRTSAARDTIVKSIHSRTRLLLQCRANRYACVDDVNDIQPLHRLTPYSLRLADSRSTIPSIRPPTNRQTVRSSTITPEPRPNSFYDSPSVFPSKRSNYQSEFLINQMLIPRFSVYLRIYLRYYLTDVARLGQ